MTACRRHILTRDVLSLAIFNGFWTSGFKTQCLCNSLARMAAYRLFSKALFRILRFRKIQ